MTRGAPIHIVPIAAGEAPDANVLAKLRRRLRTALHVRISVADPISPPAGAETQQGQLSSDAIVDALIAMDGPDPDPDQRWVLAVTSRDLGAPDRDFVFGEATVGGAWALVSYARLGDPLDPSGQALDRLTKEAIHEIGHLAGLDHCRRPRCVMHPSTSIEEIDRKNSDFCDACGDRFRRRHALDPYERGS